jgi:hypothetical protein
MPPGLQLNPRRLLHRIHAAQAAYESVMREIGDTAARAAIVQAALDELAGTQQARLQVLADRTGIAGAAVPAAAAVVAAAALVAPAPLPAASVLSELPPKAEKAPAAPPAKPATVRSRTTFTPGREPTYLCRM